MNDEAQPMPPRERMFNVPPLTLGLAVILTIIFIAGLLLPDLGDQLMLRLSFVPKSFSAMPGSVFYTLMSYALLHFGWGHFGVNIFGLLAFGSGVERLLGKAEYLLILTGGILAGALGHWVLFPDGLVPLGGASAGISALFGAALPMLVSKRSLISANIVFVVTNIAIGMMGVPGAMDQSIAWQAHLFGFFLGEIVVFILLKTKNPRMASRGDQRFS